MLEAGESRVVEEGVPYGFGRLELKLVESLVNPPTPVSVWIDLPSLVLSDFKETQEAFHRHDYTKRLQRLEADLPLLLHRLAR